MSGTSAPAIQADQWYILIVDDDSSVRETVEAIFQKAGYHTMAANNGKHALTKLNSGFPADLVITDLIMPGMTGLELIRNLRSNPKYKELAVIMMTATGERELVLDAVSYGLTQLFFKPLNYDEVIKKVQSFFAEKQAERDKDAKAS